MIALALCARIAAAQDPVDEPPPAVAPPAPSEEVLALRERVERLEAVARRSSSHLDLPEGVKLRPNGYVDFGWFDAQGDGVAYVRDPGREDASAAWVFTGDPWANPVNAQGDSADLGLDRTNISRYDPIASGGVPSFILSTVNSGAVVTVGSHFLAETSLDFEARQGVLGTSGDQLWIDLAYLEWIPSTRHDLHVFAGKFEPVFGIEYRTRKAPDRFGVTPSIMSRYTVGTPTGLKARGSVLDRQLILALSVTNGGPMTERFAHFFDEIDSNGVPTGAARLAVAPKLPFKLEVGGSAVYGAQDAQPDPTTTGWQVGADARLQTGKLTVQAEFVRVSQPGGSVFATSAVDARGWYGEADARLFAWGGLMARVDRRIAELSADDNLYLTDDLRVAMAVRFDPTFNVIAKLEYLRILELLGPEIPDDILTASAIFRF